MVIIITNLKLIILFFYFQFNEFTERPGPFLPDEFDTATAGPLEFFWLMFPVHLLQRIVQHTNSYARWTMAQINKVDPKWYDITKEELRAFLGISIMMGA